MRHIYFTVGPSQLYPTVPKYIQQALRGEIPSLSHRSSKHGAIVEHTSNGLKKLLSIPKDYHIFFTASSLESIERIIQNCVDKYSLHVVHGEFSKKLFETAVQLKKKPIKVTYPLDKEIDLTKLKVPEKTELIALTHNETSTGLSLDPKQISSLKESYPNMLIAVDVVSSAPYAPLDYRHIDIAFFSVQKGFGLPAGLGVMIVSPKALEKAIFLEKKGENIGSYHSFPSFAEKESKSQTPETPNTLGIFLFRNIIDAFQSIGIDVIRKETEQKAAFIYDFFDTHEVFRPYIKAKNARSQTTLVIDVNGQAKELLQKLAQERLIVSSGYSSFKETHIRIANFPSHSLDSVKRLIHIVKKQPNLYSLLF